MRKKGNPSACAPLLTVERAHHQHLARARVRPHEEHRRRAVRRHVAARHEQPHLGRAQQRGEVAPLRLQQHARLGVHLQRKGGLLGRRQVRRHAQ